MQNIENKNFGCTNELEQAEDYLKNYNLDIVKKLGLYQKKSDRVLDFGAGIGTLSIIWKNYYKKQPDCLEVDESQCKTINLKGFTCYSSIDQLNHKYDLIFSSNVFEHIEDDVFVLRGLKDVLVKDGVIAIYVPACMSIYNHFDGIAGHYRRYGKKELINKLGSSGYRILDCYYSDCIGYFSWLAIKIKGPKKGESENQLVSNVGLMVYDKFIFPLSKFLDNIGFKYIFGKNLVIIARNI